MLVSTRLVLLTLGLSVPSMDVLPEHATARLGTTRWRTGSPAVLVAYLADGKSLLTVNGDRVAQVWDADGKVTRRFDVSGGKPDAKTESIRVPADHVLSGDRTTLVGLGADFHLRRWDVATGKELSEFDTTWTDLRGHSLAVSRDGKRAAAVSSKRQIVCWDAISGKELTSLAAGDQEARPDSHLLAFSADGKELTHVRYPPSRSGGGPVGEPPAVVVWDVDGGKEKTRVSKTLPNVAATNRMALSPNGAMLAGASREVVHWTNLADDKPAVKIAEPGNRRGSISGMHLVFSPDSNLVIAVRRGEGLTVHEAATGKELVRTPGLPNSTVLSAWEMAAPDALAVSPDSKTLVRADGPVLRRADLTTGKDLDEGHTGGVGGVAFAPDGKSVSTLGPDGVRTWDLKSGKETAFAPVAVKSAPYLAALSPDGKVMAVTSRGGIPSLRLVDTATGKDLHVVQGGFDFRFETGDSMTFAPDGKTLAYCSAKGNFSAQLIDIATGKRAARVTASRDTPRPTPVSGKVALAPDGRLLAMTDSIRAGVGLFDAATGKELARMKLTEDSRSRLGRFGPDGRTLALELSDGTVGLYEVASLQLRETLGEKTKEKAPGRSRNVRGLAGGPLLAWSPDGRLMARAEDERAVHLWDVRAGKAVATLTGHRAEVRSLAFSRDGKTLVSGSADTTALLWDLGAIREKLAAAGPALGKDRAEECWNDLLDPDARKAFAAVRDLAADPKQSLPLLKARLKPFENPEAGAVAKLIAELDSDQFAARDRARKALEAMGEVAGSALREALKSDASAEVRKAAEAILGGLKPFEPTGDALRAVRAVEVLEWVATGDAIELLKSLGAGSADVEPTRQARAALKRLGN